MPEIQIKTVENSSKLIKERIDKDKSTQSSLEEYELKKKELKLYL